MSTPTSIDICICTFRRAHISVTLASLASLEMPFNSTVRIIVADNDDEPSAQVIVAQAAAKHGLNVKYVHAPARNISIARNACLDAATADFVVFIDDDEIAAPEWLKMLMITQRETLAPVVLGRACAVYDAATPEWVIRLDLHSTQPVWVKGRIVTGYTTNVLIERQHPTIAALRFRLDFGVSGGEDTDYFTRAHQAGATIAYAPEAVTYEGVPLNRCTMKWLRNRRYRSGQTHGTMLLEQGKLRGPHFAKAISKAALCFLMVIWSPLSARKWILRGMLHVGAASQLAKPYTKIA